MATEIDWKNYETLHDLVERMQNGEKDVYVPDELGQWFEEAAGKSGERGSILSDGMATFIYGALYGYDHKGWSPPVDDGPSDS